jgi:hypothetical protein
MVADCVKEALIKSVRADVPHYFLRPTSFQEIGASLTFVNTSGSGLRSLGAEFVPLRGAHKKSHRLCRWFLTGGYVMNTKTHFNMLLAAATLILAAPVQATLEARYLDVIPGIDAYYDTATDLTWLRDVHHADGTFNMTNPSSLTWVDANAWATGLGAGWRMPSTLDATGWETNSEMYALSTEGNMTSAYFQGLVTDPARRPVYWSSTEVSYWGPTVHFNFSPTPPHTDYSDDHILAFDNTYAFAVHSGDVGRNVELVPEPETYAMMLAGLALLGFVARRKKQPVAQR